MAGNSVARSGLVGVKLGMSRIFDETGNVIPITLIEIQDNRIVGHKIQKRDGYDAVIVGYGKNKPQRVSKPIRGICAKAKVEPVKGMKEFRISQDCFVDVGAHLGVEHFVIGQYIDVAAITIGKGFAGVMKRHNFGGLEASHGVSVSHRSHGSTGQRQDPGKVFKNKKMAGHMGSVKVTTQNLQVVDIDVNMSIIAVRGAVPGAEQSLVYLQDAVKKALPLSVPLPAGIKADTAEEIIVEVKELTESLQETKTEE